MIITLAAATTDEAQAIAALRNAVAEGLTRDYGQGHWSSAVSERGILHAVRESKVFTVRKGEHLVATLRLATKKPWAIDKAYFTRVERCFTCSTWLLIPVFSGRESATVPR